MEEQHAHGLGHGGAGGGVPAAGGGGGLDRVDAELGSDVAKDLK